MEQYKSKLNSLSIDGMLVIVGEYGRCQKLITLLFCIMTIPCIFPVMILYFAADNPSWKCVSNSSICLYNLTFSSDDQGRCSIPREDWEYVLPKQHSLVVQYDVYCDDEWLISLATSMLFIGWIFGAGTLGWFADNYGRKVVIFVSISVVIVVGCVSAFMPTLYMFIICRFIVGFFLPGTFPYMFVLISEIVGSKYRAFSGLSIYVFAAFSLSLLCLKAYFIRDWKLLFVVCNAPYLFILFFYKFIPESVRYLRVKGETTTLSNTFDKIARWNKRVIPAGATIVPVESSISCQKSNPVELFRTTSMAYKTIIQAFSYFVIQMSYYGVYIAAGDITGHKYRDYMIITVIEIPLTFIIIDFVERFGRRKTTMGAVLFGALACTGLGVAPQNGTFKIVRIILALIGKCSVSSGSNTIQTWTVELYATHVRGEAVGLMQILTRAGAATAPWIDKEFAKVYFGGSFLLMGISLFISFCLLYFLPEMKGVITNDVDNEHNTKTGFNNLGLENNIETSVFELTAVENGFEICH